MTELTLTNPQRRKLKALAHSLKPIVQVGQAGITDAVVAAVDHALRDHELIKVQMREPEDKKSMAQQLADSAGAALCTLIGHTAVLYRRHPEDPRIKLD